MDLVDLKQQIARHAEDRISWTYDTNDLQALASSHTQLLTAAKDLRAAIDQETGGYAFAVHAREQFDAAIAAAEGQE